MGQTWSYEQQSRNVNRTSQDQVRSRQSSFSEPPASTSGGHTVCKIPEDEEVNVRTTEIQYADWKKASGASGILEEKSSHLKQVESNAASDPPGCDGTSFPRRTRAKSVEYQHLADFSMFPDKFSMPMASRKLPTDEKGSITPLKNVSAALFGYRTRAFSTSEAAESVTKDESKRTSDQKDRLSPVAHVRKRSASFNGRLPFFDFSMIPDKDPNYQEIPRRKGTSKPEPSSKTDDVPTIVVQPASVVAAALTMAANSDTEMTGSKKASSPPRFTFFNHGNSPDKDSEANISSGARREN